MREEVRERIMVRGEKGECKKMLGEIKDSEGGSKGVNHGEGRKRESEKDDKGGEKGDMMRVKTVRKGEGSR